MIRILIRDNGALVIIDSGILLLLITTAIHLIYAGKFFVKASNYVVIVSDWWFDRYLGLLLLNLLMSGHLFL